MIDPRPIIVTGIPRSGTSLIAHALANCGGWVGDCIGPGPKQPGGYWENRLFHEVARGILADHGINPRCGPPIINPFTVKWHADVDVIRERLVSEYPAGRPWVLKNSHAALGWPVWTKVFPEAHWLVVMRNPKHTRESLVRYGLVNDQLRAIKYVDDFHGILDQISSFPHMAITNNVHLVSSDMVVRNGPDELDQLVNRLGLTWSKDCCRHVNTKWWNNPGRKV